MCIFNNINCVEYILFRMRVFILKHLCFFIMVRIKFCPYRSPGSPPCLPLQCSGKHGVTVRASSELLLCFSQFTE